MKDIFKELTDEQINCVKTDNHSLVIACPGSGKTRVLTHKIAYELQQLNNHKQKILALTHTNIAADTIAERIQDFDIPINQLWSGTIHSFCLEWILRPYAGYNDWLKKGFKVAEPEYMDKTIKSIDPAFNIFNCNTGFDCNGNLLENDPSKKTTLESSYSKLRNDRYLTFDDILLQSYFLVRDKEFISAALSRIFTWICVDEYQDTNELQYAILHQIIKTRNGYTKIFYVGDPNQTIYKGLGGYPKNQEEIEIEIGASLTRLTLTGNFRSSERIISFYKNFQVDNELIASLGKLKNYPSSIQYCKKTSKDELPEKIANIIEYYLSKGINPEDICIISPIWYPLYPMAKQIRSKLPEVSLSARGLSPLPRIPDNFWFKVARLALTKPEPRLTKSRIRWANDVLREIISVSPDILAVSSGIELLKIINRIKIDEQDGWSYLMKFFVEFENKINVELSSIPFLNSLLSQLQEGAIKRNTELKKHNILVSIDEYRKMFQPRHGVFISSCHGVKGEEYDVVIAFGILEDFLPNKAEAHDRDVAKRLLYVVASRAKKYLHLFSETGSGKKPTIEMEQLDFDFN